MQMITLVALSLIRWQVAMPVAYVNNLIIYNENYVSYVIDILFSWQKSNE